MHLSDDAKKTLLAEAERLYPHECCGALLGTDNETGGRLIEFAVPIDSTTEDGEKHHRFQITADDVIKVEHTARERGSDVLGFYHSHPDHPAVPSEYDREHALPYYSYLIIPVENGKAHETLAWKLKADRSGFEREEIV